MPISDIIRRIRIDANMTQNEFAEKLLVSRTTVSKWENGQSLPDIDNIQKICEAFNIEPNEFLNTSNDYKFSDKKNYEKQYVALIIGFIISFLSLIILTIILICIKPNPSNSMIIVDGGVLIVIICILLVFVIVVIMTVFYIKNKKKQ